MKTILSLTEKSNKITRLDNEHNFFDHLQVGRYFKKKKKIKKYTWRLKNLTIEFTGTDI